jgi:hypothetical protein
MTNANAKQIEIFFWVMRPAQKNCPQIRTHLLVMRRQLMAKKKTEGLRKKIYAKTWRKYAAVGNVLRYLCRQSK